ncbi:A24 family peptidase [Frigidibacter sp. SD6-1]|uniref:prepilin peptidase n=1 Tax=Frigidibacter sp. SD6-1 TaxID=3032581 RepID=UPI0024E00CC5|nr:A24 family peptidase [Frigidibacter sp. SD6-1]
MRYGEECGNDHEQSENDDQGKTRTSGSSDGFCPHRLSDNLKEVPETHAKTCWLTLYHLPIYAGSALLAWPDEWPWLFVLGPLLILASAVDIERFEIPDGVSAFLALTGLGRLAIAPTLPALSDLVAILIWPSLALTICWGYYRFRGWHGLGGGDVKLLIGIAIWVGFDGATFVILGASISALLTLVGLAMIQQKSLRDLTVSAIAFGPFLCLFTWVAFLYGGLR